MAHDSQIVRTKENLKLSHRPMVGPGKDKHQLQTNLLKLDARAVIESEDRPTVVLMLLYLVNSCSTQNIGLIIHVIQKMDLRNVFKMATIVAIMVAFVSLFLLQF